MWRAGRWFMRFLTRFVGMESGEREEFANFQRRYITLLNTNELLGPKSRKALSVRELMTLDGFWGDPANKRFYWVSHCLAAAGLPVYGKDGERLWVPNFVKLIK